MREYEGEWKSIDKCEDESLSFAGDLGGLRVLWSV
jgi:hypothetical protein